MQVLLGVSSQCTFVCKQEVADQSFLHFGVGFQSPQIKEAPVSSVADRGASTSLGERRRQHLSKQQTEEDWGLDAALFYTVRVWKWVRHVAVLYDSDRHAVVEGQYHADNLGGQPTFDRMDQRPGLLTVSKALVRSKNKRYKSWRCSRHFSCSWRTANIMSTAPLFCLNPH